ncbi:hypothetical protein A4X06_0g5554 [Tilletia controversa]|uniref:Uncharacterized protein n=1 Tax=Tilletia controversa TaxID=13291 RepID=A0A8X7SW23_9BASI|nr:hypothetical protein A4X06_0g5554 [Tilletia controversa]
MSSKHGLPARPDWVLGSSAVPSTTTTTTMSNPASASASVSATPVSGSTPISSSDVVSSEEEGSIAIAIAGEGDVGSSPTLKALSASFAAGVGIEEGGRDGVPTAAAAAAAGS